MRCLWCLVAFGSFLNLLTTAENTTETYAFVVKIATETLSFACKLVEGAAFILDFVLDLLTLGLDIGHFGLNLAETFAVALTVALLAPAFGLLMAPAFGFALLAPVFGLALLAPAFGLALLAPAFGLGLAVALGLVTLGSALGLDIFHLVLNLTDTLVKVQTCEL